MQQALLLATAAAATAEAPLRFQYDNYQTSIVAGSAIERSAW